MAKQPIKTRARRIKSKAGMRVAEVKDWFRRRPVIKAHEVGATKNKHVLIQEPTIINLDGKEVFQAKFVAPRLGSPLNPYHDHVIAIAIQTAVHQAVIGSLKKFRGLKRTAVPLMGIKELKIHKGIPQKAGVLIRLEEIEIGRKLKKEFYCRIFDEENGDVYMDGVITVGLVSKKQPKPKK
ncbi:MAG: hypothetical protein ABIH20_05245 [Candidatus Diapherotrites archaeon]